MSHRVRALKRCASLAIATLWLAHTSEAAERLYMEHADGPFSMDGTEGSMLGKLGRGTGDMVGGGLPSGSQYVPGQSENSKYTSKPTGDPIADLKRVVAKIKEHVADCHVPLEDRPTPKNGELIGSDPSKACMDMYHVLHKATGKVGKYPRQTCKTLRPLITAPFMDLVTHRVITTCCGMMDGLDPNGKDSKKDQVAWLRVLTILMKMPTMRAYWESVDAPQTYGMWANLLKGVGDFRGAEQMYGLACQGCMRIGDVKQATMELNSVMTLMSRDGRHDEAKDFFDKMIKLKTPQGEKMHYRNMWQRSAFFLPFLSGDKFPFDRPVEGGGKLPEGCPLPTIKAIQDNWPAIMEEFQALIATPEVEEVSPEEAKDVVDKLDLGLSDEASLFSGILDEVKDMGEKPKEKVGFAVPFGEDLNLVKGRDPEGWQHFVLGTGGKWDDTPDGHCSRMPTVCRLLKKDPAVSGRIPLQKVEQVNSAGGYQPPEKVNHWIHPDYRNKKTRINEDEFMENSAGYITDQIIAVLKLNPGATIMDHVGPSNSRFNLQFGFQVPKGAHLKAGNVTRAVPLGPDVIVFDESFEHGAWNENTDLPRYILQIHTWHPGLMPLVQPPLWMMDEDPLTQRVSNSNSAAIVEEESDLFVPDKHVEAGAEGSAETARTEL